jgi:hypothetical protein
MMVKDNKCYENYIPWERKIKENDLEKKVLSIGPDEGIRILAELTDGNMAKIFVNKTGLEYVITIKCDNGKEHIFNYKEGAEAYKALSKQVKKIREILLY